MSAASTAWVALEGPCCAGKTTLGNRLLEHLGADVVTILPDYADFVGGVSGMPDPDPASWPQERSALDLLLGTEDGRLRSHLPNTSPPLVLIDRSVLTLVAHCAGLDHRNVDRPAFAERAAALLAADPRPCWPQAVLYLDIDHNVQVERNATGKFADNSVFMDISYNAGFREHFARMRAADDLPMAWIAGDAPVDDVLERAMVFLSTQVGVRTLSA